MRPGGTINVSCLGTRYNEPAGEQHLANRFVNDVEIIHCVSCRAVSDVRDSLEAQAAAKRMQLEDA